MHEQESAERAAVLIRKACLAEGIVTPGLVLHADNGAPMKGATMLVTLQRLGIVPSFSRSSVSNDNPYAESLFGTMKYTPAYPCKPFDSLEAARDWVHRFVHWYNHQHHHSGIRFVTPPFGIAERTGRSSHNEKGSMQPQDSAILNVGAALPETGRRSATFGSTLTDRQTPTQKPETTQHETRQLP